VLLNGGNKSYRVAEKPQKPSIKLVSTPVYLSSVLFPAGLYCKIFKGIIGVYQLSGEEDSVHAYVLRGAWFDIGNAG
jgi:hypothetical protein